MTALRDKVVADGRAGRPRDFYTDALREYHARYGELTAACFSPGSAKRCGRPDLVERYYDGRANGDPWPSLNAIKTAFDGSFNDARRSLGLKPNPTGPASGRRKAGEADAILTVRERIRYMPTDRMVEVTRRAYRLQERVSNLEARLAEARERADRAEAKFREVRDRSLTLRARGAVEAPARTITKTKTVKVRDEKTLERLRAKLADTEAARRALAADLRAAERERDRAKGEAADLLASATERGAVARSATDAAHRASDRLAAAEARAERLASELAAARETTYGAAEAAATSDLVRRAEDRADLAEIRAARAEREMVEQAAAISGEPRKLTTEEMAALRANGPAGPNVLAAALQKLGKARKTNNSTLLSEALVDVARASLSWRDRL